MDFSDLVSLVPAWGWLLLALTLAGPLVSFVTALGIFVLKRIVIVRERRKPPHVDTGDYELTQGREIRPERQDQSRSEPSERP